ncbi:MAG: DNA-directed RNA polymerase subunit N [Candidatus Njordarchaeota archaeon]
MKKIIVPVRCFSCGAVIGHLWEDFAKRVSRGEDPGKVLDALGVKKECCRRMLLSHIELVDKLIKYQQQWFRSVEW